MTITLVYPVQLHDKMNHCFKCGETVTVALLLTGMRTIFSQYNNFLPSYKKTFSWQKNKINKICALHYSWNSSKLWELYSQERTLNFYCSWLFYFMIICYKIQNDISDKQKCVCILHTHMKGIPPGKDTISCDFRAGNTKKVI